MGWDGGVADSRTDSDEAARRAEEFETHRGVLTGVAYRMLGRVADAEDVVQEAWLRWADAPVSEVRNPRGYLIRVTTRLAIDRLRQITARRESYVGPWLPDPLVTDYGETVPDTAEGAVQRDSVSLAVLVVLESLSPLERAVFVLHEAFALPYAEIAGILDRAEAAVRQLGGRARRHVEEGRPRYPVDPRTRRELTERFLAAAVGENFRELLELLAPDVRLVSDSGGRAKAPRRVIESADKVGRFLFAVAEEPLPGAEFRFVELNGQPALLALSNGRPDTLLQIEATPGPEGLLIESVFLVRNPDKLAGLHDAR